MTAGTFARGEGLAPRFGSAASRRRRGRAAQAPVSRAGRRGWRGKRSLVLTSEDAPGTRRSAIATPGRLRSPTPATARETCLLRFLRRKRRGGRN